MSENGHFEPHIVGFLCNWCTYTAADLAGVSRMKYAANVRTIRLMCSGRVDPQFIMDAFAKGADGVLIGGCHPGDCHYGEGNYKMLRRFQLLQRMLGYLGVEPARLRLEWRSSDEWPVGWLYLLWARRREHWRILLYVRRSILVPVWSEDVFVRQADSARGVVPAAR